MLIPNETVTVAGEILPNRNFLNIIARRVYSHTPAEELEQLTIMIGTAQNYDITKPVDRICINMRIIDSVCHN
ncbi:MAG: hypothetical protein V4549_07695 [Bacteroidota bacterium]